MGIGTQGVITITPNFCLEFSVSQSLANDLATTSVLQGIRVESLDITRISELRDDAHLSKHNLKSNNGSQDCLHS